MNSGENLNHSSKKPFDSTLTLESFLVALPSSKEVLASTSRIVELLNTYGVAVIEFADEESAREQLLCFRELFGNTMGHDRSDSDGIAEVAVIDESSPYPGISSRAYTFHTDGSYDENPPKIVALRCQIQAREGGITQLASGKRIYEYLLNEDIPALEALYRDDALLISRAGKSFSGAIFRKYSEGRVAMRYRTDEAAHTSENTDVCRGVKLVQDFLSDEKNLVSFKLESRQVLITDNLTVLHARTAFGSNDPRQMHRLWFDGMPQQDSGLRCGFVVNS